MPGNRDGAGKLGNRDGAGKTGNRDGAGAPVTCFADARAEEAFLPATLEAVRPCAARPEYVELCFSTAEGAWNWCFRRPPRRRKRPGGPIALRSGPYGVHAYLLGEVEPGEALEISSALPMITAGSDVYVARDLVVNR
jgi:hypothetical protein